MNNSVHSFHIPVMGLCYTIDSPVKVARFGISSVVSIIEDELVEKMRQFHSEKSGEEFIPIPETDIDHRAKRITAYLNLLNRIVTNQIEELKHQTFNEDSEISKYFELLPDESVERKLYRQMLATKNVIDKIELQNELRTKIKAGSIDVNIMSKIDLVNYDKTGEPLSSAYCDAVAAFRGYANSDLNSSIVFSAGYNPRLYSFIEKYDDFFPDENGELKKKIILKVSDYRSALIQGKILAKKGLWISEFRIESGLNCGGHAFPTNGELLGPILEEFRNNKQELANELFQMSSNAMVAASRKFLFNEQPELKITVQGGIGTAHEDKFLHEYYQVNGTGWGSPFLLVPEAVNIDETTLQKLAVAEKDDYYISDASPLGVPFNNFRKSSSEQQRVMRIEKGRPGSPCYKKFLSSNTEFTEHPICTASREYQELKIRQLEQLNLTETEFKNQYEAVVAKDCLCEGLSTAALVKNHLTLSHKLEAIAICPGPNLAYFSGIFSLKQMVDHIYGRTDLLNKLNRPNMFLNELNLYVDYLKKEIAKNMNSINAKQAKYFLNFKTNLESGIAYYKNLIPKIKIETEEYLNRMKDDLLSIENSVKNISVPMVEV